MKMEMKQVQERERAPQCQGIVTTVNNKRRRCSQDGVAVWVIGDFGREAKMLCNSCVIKTRAAGWKVRYQLEGDNPQDNVESTSTIDPTTKNRG